MTVSLVHQVDGVPDITKQRLRPLINGIADILTFDDTNVKDEMALSGLSDNSYIGVGTLTYETKEIQPDCPAWTIVNREQSLPEYNTSIPAELKESVESLGLLRSNFWIRCEYKRHGSSYWHVVVRVYVLPEDVARRDVARSSVNLRCKIRHLMNWELDTSPATWTGDGELSALRPMPSSMISKEESLSYIFNNLNSPSPDPSRLKDKYDKMAAERVLEGSHDRYLGFKTALYPYQRRSIATMIQKEVQPGWQIDPRVVRVTGPTGTQYFRDRITAEVLQEAAQYEDPRGGILAETMGYGKTLIVLGLILATKHVMPEIPIDAERIDLSPSPCGAKPLRLMAADIAHRDNLKWRQFFEVQEQLYDRSYPSCVKLLERPYIYKQIAQASLLRNTRSGPQLREVLLCKTTLVIVPNNLFLQWQSEIKKHIHPNRLDVLYVHESSGPLPSKYQLAEYDMILIEKGRFAVEIGHRAAPPSRQDHENNLQLPDMHFLRLVVDEGHTFASSAANAAMNPLSMVRAHSRWIVTGTPSEGLLGEEMELLARSTLNGQNSMTSEMFAKNADRVKQDNEDLGRLGKIVSRLLLAKPWSNGHEGNDLASWNTYMRLGTLYRCEPVVRGIMRSLIVRHKAGEIEAELPPLRDEFVSITPSTFDIFSMDLFTLVLACNAITSERVDEDYIFDRRNWRSLDVLVRNIRHASFYWTGFSAKEATRSLQMLQSYRDAHPEMSSADNKLVHTAETVVPQILGNEVWDALIRGQEMGYVVTNLPSKVNQALGITDTNSFASQGSFAPHGPQTACPVVASRLIGAQDFLAQRMKLGQPNPLQELSDNATKIAKVSEETRRMMNEASVDKDKPTNLHSRGIPDSGLRGEIKMKTKHIESHKTLGLVKVAPSKRKAEASPSDEDMLKADNIRLVGTASAKLSYILNKVVQLYKEEKILIFYEGDDIAWYIAQGLEILAIPHFIYSNGITAAKRNERLQTFMRDDSLERVMLIDLKQGGHGLNIVCASRVFFVNHVWDGNKRAQAIKRAHRIGQTKPVFVETLVLDGSFERDMINAQDKLTTTGRHLADRDVLLGDAIYEVLKDFKFRSHYALSNFSTRPEGAVEQFSQMTNAPLLFPKVNEYLDKLATTSEITIKKESDEAHQSDMTLAGQMNAAGEGEIQAPDRKKKVARFE